MSRSMSNLAVRIVSSPINACFTHNSIDINAMPLYKGQPHHGFLLDSLKALELCTNLTDFRLAVNIMPSFLNIIQSKARLRTLSFGKERPREVCSDEACYAQNRRAVTIVSAAGAGS